MPFLVEIKPLAQLIISVCTRRTDDTVIFICTSRETIQGGGRRGDVLVPLVFTLSRLQVIGQVHAQPALTPLCVEETNLLTLPGIETRTVQSFF